MGKFSFYNWLSLQENQHNIEINVARFLEDILVKSADLKKRDMQNGRQQPYVNYVRQIWPPDAISDNEFTLPNSFPNDIAGRRVQFKLKSGNNAADTIHNNRKFEGFIINVSPFDYARSVGDVDRHLEILKSAVHHESEHIYNIGAGYDSNDWHGEDKHRMAMQYMSNPGEIRAHARQMAQIYSKYFPGHPFELSKAQSILDKPEFNTTHRNYFDNFAKPEIWQNHVNKFGYTHENPHDQIMRLVPQFLSQYQQ